VRHYRVTWADAVAAHEAALALGPSRPGISDRRLVESAIARPYQGHCRSIYHRSIARKAAALFEAIAQNHGFIDGNKRTAIIVTAVLIERSGYELRLTGNRDNIMKAIVKAVVVHAITFEELVAWFKARLRRRGQA
jgi:death-on-curing protein